MTSASEVPASFRSSAVRPGPVGLIREGLADVLSRRRLIRYLVQADLKKKGADTLLGNIWWVIDPLLQMVVYVVLVTLIFQRKQPDYPIFIFSAILPWKWFTSSVGDGVNSVVLSDRLIKQMQFPKIVLPIASTMSAIANASFGLIPLAILMILFYHHRISIWLLTIPLIAVVQLLFTLPVTIAVSSSNVFYRDIGNLMRHVLRLWWYLSPGLYGVDLILQLTKEFPIVGTIMLLNPFATLFTGYRDVIYYGKPPDWIALLILAAVSLVLLVVATWYFKRVEPAFAKVL
jgi:homopolymeric O-antigen transport system permease protein